jgi:hypothetical protein
MDFQAVARKAPHHPQADLGVTDNGQDTSLPLRLNQFTVDWFDVFHLSASTMKS